LHFPLLYKRTFVDLSLILFRKIRKGSKKKKKRGEGGIVNLFDHYLTINFCSNGSLLSSPCITPEIVLKARTSGTT
jgi:hypothetical protein